MEPWEAKAHRLISAMALAAYNASNRRPDGRLYKRHRPYTLPAAAARLVAVLGLHDRAEAEREAKAMFQTRAVLGIADHRSL